MTFICDNSFGYDWYQGANAWKGNRKLAFVGTSREYSSSTSLHSIICFELLRRIVLTND